MDVPDTSKQLDQKRVDPPLPPLALGILMGLCAAKLLLHLFTSVRHYGYFRDELYYLDMARHLDWGYVDCAPLIAVYAKIALWMGGSLATLRILPALAGAGLIALTILIARELGGERYAQFLAGFSCCSVPPCCERQPLTMNAFELLFWMACIWWSPGFCARETRGFGCGSACSLDLGSRTSTLRCLSDSRSPSRCF